MKDSTVMICMAACFISGITCGITFVTVLAMIYGY